MKTLYIYIIGVVLLLLAACDIEDSGNRELNGLWKLQGVPSGITWSFQGHLLELRDLDYVERDIMMQYDYSGDFLKVSQPYLVERDSDDIPVNDVSQLLPYGITKLSERFSVMKLTGNRMTLVGEAGQQLEFRKY